nr:immunoglobulin heavy chain junction region [Macaca mulatta]MOW97210.1 immunoglobulin heavy chain junction region [Macaca mulatta]
CARYESGGVAVSATSNRFDVW